MSKIALFMGRFQPFHNGHLMVLRRALGVSESVVIAIGSVNLVDLNNPLSYDERVRIIESVVSEEHIAKRITKIVGVKDYPDDKRWAREVISQAGEFDIVVGNNDWTNDVLEAEGYEILRTEMFDRDQLEGAKIRELYKRGDKEWVSRVPGYLVSMIDDLFSRNEDMRR